MRRHVSTSLISLILTAANLPPLFATEPDTTSGRMIIDSVRMVNAEQVVVTGTRNEVRLKDSPVRVEVIGQQRIRTTAMVNLECR
jgi:outer membrane receptor protein involved in Fe transport